MHKLLETQISSASRIAFFARIGYQTGSKHIRKFLESENCQNIPLQLFQDLVAIEYLYQNYFLRNHGYNESVRIISQKLRLSQSAFFERIKKKLCMITLNDIIWHIQCREQFEFQFLVPEKKYALKTLSKKKIIAKQISFRQRQIIQQIQRAIMKYDHAARKEHLLWSSHQEEMLKSQNFKQLFPKKPINDIMYKTKTFKTSQRIQILKEWMKYDDGCNQYSIE